MVLACGAFATGGSAAQEQPGPAAVFSARPVKASFSEGEAILLLLGLRNTGPQPIVADTRFALGSTVRVHVTGPQGRTTDWKASFEAGVPEFRVIAPGNRVTRVVCLNCDARVPFAYPFGEPGTYTVKLSYTAPALTAPERARFPRADALDQNLEAAPFQLRVTPPAVRFTAQPTQRIFHAGEPVTFHFRLENTSNQGVLAAYDLPLGSAVRLRITNESGRQIPLRGPSPNGQPLLSTVDAGGAVDAVYPITPQNFYGKITTGFEIREPGTYTVHAVYDLAQPIDVLQGYVGVLPILIVPGPIPAPPVKFTISAAASAGAPAKP